MERQDDGYATIGNDYSRGYVRVILENENFYDQAVFFYRSILKLASVKTSLKVRKSPGLLFGGAKGLHAPLLSGWGAPVHRTAEPLREKSPFSLPASRIFSGTRRKLLSSRMGGRACGVRVRVMRGEGGGRILVLSI